jgi:CubicO group peptidase (beta-lactamase class C family)
MTAQMQGIGFGAPTRRRGGASTFEHRLRSGIAEATAQFGVPGAQVAWLHDGSIDQIEIGVTGWGRGAAVLPDTRFPLGSVTKVFTASLALLLVDDGALHLDEPIADVLPPGECRDVLGELSLRQLLSHSSGLENDNSKALTAFRSVREYVRAYEREHDRLLFSPGEHFSYANAGYIVVGCLIEAVTGRPWAESLQTFLLDPLEVKGTFFLSEPSGPGVMADGHVRRKDGEIVRLSACSLGRALAPAGGLALNAASVLRLLQLHLSQGRTRHGFRLLDPTLVATMQTAHKAVPDPSFADAWGLGWSLALAGLGGPEPTFWFGHEGNSDGSTAYVRASARDGFAVALLANCVPADREWQLLLTALAELGLEVGDPALPEPPEQAPPIDPAIAGRYENGMASWVVEHRGGDGFWLSLGEQESSPLQSIGGDRCVARPTGGDVAPFLVAFLRDRAERVQYLHAEGRIARRVA